MTTKRAVALRGFGQDVMRRSGASRASATKKDAAPQPASAAPAQSSTTIG
eukprot:CAMPEP_0117602680 /NCGR_PEP_ID=MMETSP0784-20121206/77716_1 /TAXON_ID=39447 /ORGANISM="" /LENGTH=49 /DNA_ID= /DNA_START= /DNA_END= /DNA_ORIENTATION=